LSLQPIAIDAEPDPNNTVSFGLSSSTLEAGLPATGVMELQQMKTFG
jgi:hypothetical protein